MSSVRSVKGPSDPRHSLTKDPDREIIRPGLERFAARIRQINNIRLGVFKDPETSIQTPLLSALATPVENKVQVCKRGENRRGEHLFDLEDGSKVKIVRQRNGKRIKLGQGGFGEVFLADFKDSKGVVHPAVVKKLLLSLRWDKDLSPIENLEDALLECRFLERCQGHSNIVKIYGYFLYAGRYGDLEDPDKPTKMILVIENVSGGDLESQDVNLEHLFKQVYGALSYIHEKGIIHCDLKPANLMVDDKGQIKLADFGISQDSKNVTPFTRSTPYYFAPETTIGSGFPIDEPTKIDVFSFGVTLLVKARGGCSQISHLLDKHWTADVIFPAGEPQNPKSLDYLIYRMLQRDPDKRISMDQLPEHPWAKAALAAE
jgi:serine/threonine protein kinase